METSWIIRKIFSFPFRVITNCIRSHWIVLKLFRLRWFSQPHSVFSKCNRFCPSVIINRLRCWIIHIPIMKSSSVIWDIPISSIIINRYKPCIIHVSNPSLVVRPKHLPWVVIFSCGIVVIRANSSVIFWVNLSCVLITPLITKIDICIFRVIV